MKIYNLSTDKGRQAFYSSHLWRGIRILKLGDAPLCEICSTKEHPVPSSQVHHKQRIQDYPTYFEACKLENLQSICASCHSKRTAAENNFGSNKLELYNPMWKR